MILFVVAVNLVLTLFNCYLVWKLWQWRGAIALFARTVQQLEEQSNSLFAPLPTSLNLRQINLQDFRLSYQTLTLRLLRLQQILFLIGFLTRSPLPMSK